MEGIPNASGIYKITCTVTGKFYIGSAVNLQKRRKDHFYTLRRGIHRNPKMQHAWNKHGEQSFTFEVIELVLAPEILIVREQYYFSMLNPFGSNGFNIDHVAGSRLGSKHSPETIKKSSDARRGKPSTRVGYKHSPETLGRMKTSHLGKTLSKESRIKLSDSLKKKPPVSEETGKKISLAKMGHAVSPESRAKISVSKTGHTHAPEVYASRRKTLIVTAPDGTEYVVTGVRRFCEDHDLDISSLMRTVKGFDNKGNVCSQHKGWRARHPD